MVSDIRKTIVEKFNHRVALVSGGIKLGGAATFLLNLAGELVRRGIDVLVVSLEHENPYASDFKHLGILLHIEDERTSIFEDRLTSTLQRIRQFKPTAVISCLGQTSYEVLRYLPPSVIRLAMLQSDFPEAYPILAAYAPFCDGLIAVSQEIENKFRAHPVLGRVRTYYLPYGIAIPKNRVQRDRENDRPIRILYLGRLCRAQKRVELFPEILRHLRVADITFVWTIAGDGPERSWLQRNMPSSMPESEVTFSGAISYQDVPLLLDDHDVFLLTSDHEGLPLSLLEGMAHGLVPVVSKLSSGIPEVVDQDCGILVDPSNTEGYADGIAWLSRNRSDLLAMSQEAVKRVSATYSVEAMTDRWLSILRVPEEQVPWVSIAQIESPITGAEHWKYMPPVRLLRRLAKNIRSRFQRR